MSDVVVRLIDFVRSYDRINDKAQLARLVSDQFGLTKDRSVFCCKQFAIRFSASGSPSFGNTVLSLSNLEKYDDRPFIVCLVTPSTNHLMIANTSFLKKISHSSQELRENNIRGSFNGSDIVRNFEGIPNCQENIEELFLIHESIGFDGNLKRLVEATTNIEATGSKLEISADDRRTILDAPSRAESFVASDDFIILKADLDDKVNRFKNEIILASLIENVNVRSRVIEYLIAGQGEQLRQQLITALQSSRGGLPLFKTDNKLGDYERDFQHHLTETDVKTKIMALNSNPKAYNIDKMLEFLSVQRSVFLFYFVGVDLKSIVNTVLISVFQDKILQATIVLKHWSGRNSRGVTQLDGKRIKELILCPEFKINPNESQRYLVNLMAL